MRRLLAVFICTFMIIFIFSSCCKYNDHYFKEANWDCDRETFLSYYDNLYHSKIEELKNKYNLQYQEKLETEYKGEQDVSIYYQLYCENFTIRLVLYNGTALGICYAYLYYYGDGVPSKEYKNFEDVVNFLNEFINYVSYDAKTDKNYFKTLYNEANNNEDLYASYDMHFDHTIGNLYYLVYLNPPKSTGGYFYMMEENKTLEKENYLFEFKGLLKPIVQSTADR